MREMLTVLLVLALIVALMPVVSYFTYGSTGECQKCGLGLWRDTMQSGDYCEYCTQCGTIRWYTPEGVPEDAPVLSSMERVY